MLQCWENSVLMTHVRRRPVAFAKAITLPFSLCEDAGGAVWLIYDRTLIDKHNCKNQ